MARGRGRWTRGCFGAAEGRGSSGAALAGRTVYSANARIPPQPFADAGGGLDPWDLDRVVQLLGPEQPPGELLRQRHRRLVGRGGDGDGDEIHVRKRVVREQRAAAG